VREDFLQKVIASSMPFSQSFEDGKYVARLDSVRVDLQDGLALVTLTGAAHWRATRPCTPTSFSKDGSGSRN
jgi:hypothetical protein